MFFAKVRLVSAARKQLDPVDQMITDAKWDSIRTTIKTAPLAEIKVGEQRAYQMYSAKWAMHTVSETIEHYCPRYCDRLWFWVGVGITTGGQGTIVIRTHRSDKNLYVAVLFY